MFTIEEYWATMPSAVQALRWMGDIADRGPYAMELAKRGYVIHVAIHVFGWNPVLTFQNLEMHGYTWIPSALQPPILCGPGISFPGIPPYDPNNPPPGSIHVPFDPKDYPTP